MSDPMVLGGKLLSLLDETAVVATYKPALLMSIIDCLTESGEVDSIPVERLAERAVELYWPQTTIYPTTGQVLAQSQGTQAKIVRVITEYRGQAGVGARAIPERLRREKEWPKLVRQVELSLAEMPIPRLQVPFEPFLYEFDWPWKNTGGWRTDSYNQSSRELRLMPGAAGSLISLGPLLRPFIMRWWSEHAARMNSKAEDAVASMLNLEKFMFGHDRKTLEPIAEGLLDLQAGRCFYCKTGIGKNREIDHFVPWSQSGDDGLFNLVAACRHCNNRKRSILAGPDFLESLITRNTGWATDLESLADERSWPADRLRTARITRAAYTTSPAERPLWLGRSADPETEPLDRSRDQILSLTSQLPGAVD